MEVQTYEETVKGLSASYFSDFKFFTQTFVQDYIKVTVPDTEEYLNSRVPKKEQSKSETIEAKLTKSQKALQSPSAKILLLTDNRKAKVLSSYIKETCQRKLVEIEDLTSNNCLYEAVLSQISNAEFIYSEDNTQYVPYNLRMQMLHYMATNHEVLLPLVRDYLDQKSFKEWMLDQCSPSEPADLIAPIVLRHMMKVCIF